MCLPGNSFMMQLLWQCSYTLEQSEKRRCCRSFSLPTADECTEKIESQAQRAVVQHCNNRQVKPRSKASCFTLLRRITKLKSVNSEIRSRIQIPTWKGIPRRVHATMTNPAWITHLLRTVIANSGVECISRAKTLQLHLTGMGRWNDPRSIEKLPSP